MTEDAMTDYDDVYFTNADGLQQHYRLYDRAGGGAPTVLCLPGLTRNARDFAHVADQLAGRCRMVLVEQRGRGLSAWDPQPERYAPPAYVADMFALLDHLGLDSVHVIATSLGGLMTMLMQAARPGVIKTAVINDIGPHIEAAGIEKIKGYVGGGAPRRTWDEAVAAVKTIAGDVYPDFDADQWMAFTKRLYTEKDGSIVLDYDPALANNFRQDTDNAAPELWPVFEPMKTVPTLVTRGALSDILSADTLDKMQAEHPDLAALTLPRIGHAPILDEPEVVAALEDWAARHYR